jgi:hypothetical protein
MDHGAKQHDLANGEFDSITRCNIANTDDSRYTGTHWVPVVYELIKNELGPPELLAVTASAAALTACADGDGADDSEGGDLGADSSDIQPSSAVLSFVDNRDCCLGIKIVRRGWALSDFAAAGGAHATFLYQALDFCVTATIAFSFSPCCPKDTCRCCMVLLLVGVVVKHQGGVDRASSALRVYVHLNFECTGLSAPINQLPCHQ